MFDVVAVGSNTIDAFVLTDKQYLKDGVYSYPIGTKVLIKDLHFSVGGGGTNVSVAFARLGLQVAYLGAVGKDEHGSMIMDYLMRQDVSTELVVQKNVKTGYSVILDAEGEDRTILTFKGCNNRLLRKDIRVSKLKTKWLYFSAMVGESYQTLEYLAQYAQRKGIRIAFNPSSYIAKRGKRYLSYLLKLTSLLVLNREEGQMITKKDNIGDIVASLLKMGCEHVVVTDGKRGAYASYDGGIYHAKPRGVSIVETTGAGDAFASSFLAGLIVADDVRFALSLAQTNAESVITHYGAKDKLLTMKEAKQMIRKSPVGIKFISV